MQGSYDSYFTPQALAAQETLKTPLECTVGGEKGKEGNSSSATQPFISYQLISYTNLQTRDCC